MIISETNGRKDITFYPDNTTDGVNVGILIEKLKRKGIQFKISYFDVNKIKSLTISQETLVSLLVS
jgi:hypothetical protein